MSATITNRPSAASNLSEGDECRLMMHVNSLLRAVRSGVLVVAADIDEDQCGEIDRELRLMHMDLDSLYGLTGYPRLPGTLHLMRDDDIEAEDAA